MLNEEVVTSATNNLNLQRNKLHKILPTLLGLDTRTQHVPVCWSRSSSLLLTSDNLSLRCCCHLQHCFIISYSQFFKHGSWCTISLRSTTFSIQKLKKSNDFFWQHLACYHSDLRPFSFRFQTYNQCRYVGTPSTEQFLPSYPTLAIF